ncbi:MAG: DUF1330 domain-containing protein [Rhodospirillaceae bacterium]|jgi:uncharacterized protein (DUF1330 family)|nr:DUF1330 domain-containing protein [Rhodospirillaceae bacterium]MBT4046175.1 DUF1330 domain-containing protein [Rhodospirillaceae bacterium]MBT4689169.1 DUF1330 domain-containing protein [Rhodospirillaceae bacterium]MBT5080833.1 DUF1330 domain-containing protein [Rhodospirillaceae bacterium]MBT5525254.1 DUF1330 domain-containing protein [Rhodospirillaceae bacterium]
MTAYMIVDLEIYDPEGFAAYGNDVPVLVAKYGGEYMVLDGEFEILEGDWQPHRMVMFQFPNRQAVYDLFEDHDYVAIKPIRERTAKTNIIVVDGIK